MPPREGKEGGRRKESPLHAEVESKARRREGENYSEGEGVGGWGRLEYHPGIGGVGGCWKGWGGVGGEDLGTPALSSVESSSSKWSELVGPVERREAAGELLRRELEGDPLRTRFLLSS